ncbi:hypothetical protein SAMN05216312_103476 [Cohnella sp. OV330]|uniref:DUF7309 domain-containing protein n=1 Tax=Cohnella sp. OV330 TaxID=1855288 RepID=UPI0008F1B10C|nr:hypothetical protein [Cohnella sp. OV330]SFB09548.1 hypothetical protein SAMN05216312_103476 [Cohnella sp. OV330]
MSTAPTAQQWKGLYEAAERYKEAAIWRWLSNGHLFGVRDPASGEIGYCCVFGNGGEMFGLAVYLGTEGLRTIVDMLTGEPEEDPMFSQRCLLFSLDDRAELDPAEYKRIKQLGLGYRGKKSWPTFRLHEPGYLPWPELSAAQAVYLAQALDQAVLVGQKFQFNPDELIDGDKDVYFIREARPSAEGGHSWHDAWLAPEDPPVTEESAAGAMPLDELRIAKALKGVRSRAGIWESDSFYVAMPLQEGERPFYPKMTLLVDQATGQILKFALSKEDETAAAAAEDLLTLVEEQRTLPQELWVGSEAAGEALLPLAEALKLELLWSPELPALSEARAAMEQRFG